MMPFFKNLFGGGSASKPVMTAAQGLEQLEDKAEMLKKKIEHIERQILEQVKIAQTNANTNKTRAVAALKKKRTLEENLKKAQGTLDNLENQKDMLENASANAAILGVLSDAAKIIKKQHEDLDINKVEDIVDEMREQKEISEEVSNILSQTSGKTVDEDELLKELESMQQEQLSAKLLETDKATTLPDVPTQLPAQPAASASPSKKTEEELDELKKWASAAQ